MKYLYIFENFFLDVRDDPPTEDDLKEVDNGTLIIIRWNERFEEVDGAGDWTEL